MLMKNRCLVLNVNQESVASSCLGKLFFSYSPSIKGHFCVNGIKTACDSGFFCGEEGLTIQSECNAGSSCPNTTHQEFCSPGYYSESKATECSHCQPGTKALFQNILSLVQIIIIIFENHLKCENHATSQPETCSAGYECSNPAFPTICLVWFSIIVLIRSYLDQILEIQNKLEHTLKVVQTNVNNVK